MINGFNEDHILIGLVQDAVFRADHPKITRGDDSLNAKYVRAVSGIWMKPIYTIIGESTRREVSQAELAGKLKTIYEHQKTAKCDKGHWRVFIAFVQYFNRVGRYRKKDTLVDWKNLTELNRVIRELKN